MRRTIALLIILVMAPLALVRARMNFHSLDVKHGVSDHYVQSILKDHLGYMWFATSNRLTRYDGYHFKEYSTLALGAYNDNVEWIAEDASGMIWLKTPVNYCYYDRESDRIVNDVDACLARMGIRPGPT